MLVGGVVEAGNDGSLTKEERATRQERGESDEGGAGEEDVELVAGAVGWGGGGRFRGS